MGVLAEIIKQLDKEIAGLQEARRNLTALMKTPAAKRAGYGKAVQTKRAAEKKKK